MRAEVRQIRALQRMLGVFDGPGCLMCGRQDTVETLCGRCRRALYPTPLDLVLLCVGMSPREFAELTGLSLRTVIRASKGERMSRRIAQRLAKVTGFAPEVFRERARVQEVDDGQ